MHKISNRIFQNKLKKNKCNPIIVIYFNLKNSYIIFYLDDFLVRIIKLSASFCSPFSEYYPITQTYHYIYIYI